MTNRWLVVLASSLALIAGQGAINIFAAGVFIKPVSDALGVGRGVIASGIGLSSLVTALATPFYGRLLDAGGVRRTLLPSILLFAIATSALSLLSSSPAVIAGLFMASGLCAVGQNPTAYSKVIVAWFDRDRGLALGLTLAGVGLGTALVPQLSARLIAAFGWRFAYVGLGLTIVAVGFVPVWLFLREPARGRDDTPRPARPGMSFSEARRSPRYWALTVAFLFGAMTINGSLVHVVPLLTDRGVSVGGATAALSASGLALIGGRIVAGYVMDRVFAPYVAIFFLVWPMIGIAILASGAAGAWPVVGTVMLGAGVGAEIDLMSFLIARYFGVAAFGVLHGVMFAVFLVGQALGASLMGWIYQLQRSYVSGFLAFEVFLGITGVLFATLGPYRYPPEASASAPASVRHAAGS